MKENFIYKQIDDMATITAETFDCHYIKGAGYKLTQKKKIPSIRLAKRFCKNIIEIYSAFSIVTSKRLSGKITTEHIKY